MTKTGICHCTWFCFIYEIYSQLEPSQNDIVYHIMFILYSMFSIGDGPNNTSISFDKYYYVQKPQLMIDWANKMDCNEDWVPYPTDMDGVIGWNCKQWIECRNGKELVHCTGYFSHNYPFFFRTPKPYIEGTRIMWEFMKSHKRNNLI